MERVSVGIGKSRDYLGRKIRNRESLPLSVIAKVDKLYGIKISGFCIAKTENMQDRQNSSERLPISEIKLKNIAATKHMTLSKLSICIGRTSGYLSIRFADAHDRNKDPLFDMETLSRIVKILDISYDDIQPDENIKLPNKTICEEPEQCIIENSNVYENTYEELKKWIKELITELEESIDKLIKEAVK